MTELPALAMSYEGLVEAGRAAREQVDNVQWIEGDLALQVEHLPTAERPRDPETGAFLVDDVKALKQYADDIDANYRMVKVYRQVAAAWPHEHRVVLVGWSVHRVLAGQDDRFDLIRGGMTAREAEAIVRKRNVAGRHRPSWFELLGTVADTLAKADKQLAKAETAIDRAPNKTLRAKARQYATRADDLADRLRTIGEWGG